MDVRRTNRYTGFVPIHDGVVYRNLLRTYGISFVAARTAAARAGNDTRPQITDATRWACSAPSEV